MNFQNNNGVKKVLSSEVASLLLFILTVIIFISGCSSTTQQNQNNTTQLEKKQSIKPDTVIAKVQAPPIRITKKEMVRIYNDNARFIAGLKSEEGSEFKKLENNSDWQNYAAWSNAVWSKLKEGQLKKVTAWAQNELAFVHPPKTTNKNHKLFYPFSGADFLYANTLFPRADEYLMIGLESVGKVPDIKKIPEEFWENYFLALKTSMDDILTASFFKTKDMRKDFTTQELKGTLPILMIFIVRTGHKIVTIEPVEINDSGKVIDRRLDKVAHHQYNQMHGVRITFEKDSAINNLENNQKNIYYFSIDLSNASLKQKPAFDLFLNSYGENVSFIKSASYLMHENNFSIIRSLILKHSNAHLQDDSGIPLKFFYETEENNKWKEPIFYGGYKAPIPMFKNYYQEDLKNKFADTTRTKPLPFRIGYQNLAKQSNLIIVKK
ncbi:MAG: hypothetical protein WBM13_08190 [Bacteroidia bacterium]